MLVQPVTHVCQDFSIMSRLFSSAKPDGPDGPS